MDERGDAVVPARRDFRLQPLLLDAARVLMLLGVVTIFSAGFENPAASATQAFVGLLLWLLGVCLLVLVPVAAGRFLQAALAVAAAMAIAVLKHLLAPCN
jgi:FtsH-binding integral membrane protein